MFVVIKGDGTSAAVEIIEAEYIGIARWNFASILCYILWGGPIMYGTGCSLPKGTPSNGFKQGKGLAGCGLERKTTLPSSQT
jgi:hypothetical protein